MVVSIGAMSFANSLRMRGLMDSVPSLTIWHYWIPGPGFDVIVITDIICFLPLAINDSDAMCYVIASLIDLLQSIDQLYFILYNNIS